MPFVGRPAGSHLCRYRTEKDTYSAAAVLCSPGPVSPPLTSLADLKVKEWMQTEIEAQEGGTERRVLSSLWSLKCQVSFSSEEEGHHPHMNITVLCTHTRGSL